MKTFLSRGLCSLLVTFGVGFVQAQDAESELLIADPGEPYEEDWSQELPAFGMTEVIWDPPILARKTYSVQTPSGTYALIHFDSAFSPLHRSPLSEPIWRLELLLVQHFEKRQSIGDRTLKFKHLFRQRQQWMNHYSVEQDSEIELGFPSPAQPREEIGRCYTPGLITIGDSLSAVSRQADIRITDEYSLARIESPYWGEIKMQYRRGQEIHTRTARLLRVRGRVSYPTPTTLRPVYPFPMEEFQVEDLLRVCINPATTGIHFAYALLEWLEFPLFVVTAHTRTFLR